MPAPPAASTTAPAGAPSDGGPVTPADTRPSPAGRAVVLPARWTPWQRRKNHALYLLVRVLLVLTGRLPLALTRQLGALLGWLGAWLDWPDRARAHAHLRRAYGASLAGHQRRRIVTGMFVHLGRSAGEALHARQIASRWERYGAFSPGALATWQAAIARGRGVVFCSGHLGNWELLGPVLASLGTPLYGVARQVYDPRLTRLVHAFRAGTGFHLLWRGERPLLAQLREVLARGEVVAMLVDQDMRVPGVFCDFFGHPAHTPRAPAELALDSGAALLVGHLARVREQGRWLHRFDLQELARPDAGQAADRAAIVLDLTQRMTRYLEQAIRANPAQWVWLHRRWKTRPPASGGQRGSAGVAPRQDLVAGDD